MIEEGMAGEKKGGKHSLWPSLADFFSCFFSPPVRPSVSCLQHDTSARLGSATLEVCVCYCGVYD